MVMPPFTPDYSGAAAVLFDLNAVTVLHDASGCTGNYTLYDEPRWYGSRAAVFCSGLRRMDVILGEDDKLIARVLQAVKEREPELVALIASPVPMVIGTDVEGIAQEIEERTGLPSIGVNCNGTDYYDLGAFKASKLLLSRFLDPSGKVVRGRVNILGALSMDYTEEEMNVTCSLLHDAGYEVNTVFPRGYDTKQIRKMGEAQVNLAISRFGFLLARHLEKEVGTPYLCTVPVGKGGKERLLKGLKEVCESGKSHIILQEDGIGSTQTMRQQESVSNQTTGQEGSDSGQFTGQESSGSGQFTGQSGTANKRTVNQRKKVLIIGEQVYGNSLRCALQAEDPEVEVTVCSLFGQEKALALPQDRNLKTEKEMVEVLNDSRYQEVIADPLFRMLLQGERRDVPFLPLPQYAISSKFGGDRSNWMGREISIPFVAHV